MNKIKSMSESSFLKLFFAFLSLAFLVGACCMPDRSAMVSGLWEILSNPIKQPSNGFVIGGYAATFLSVSLVCFVFTALAYLIPGCTVNTVTTLGFVLTAGFSFWGINLFNIWPTMIGCVLYAVVKKQPVSKVYNAMLFCTGVTPIFSELLLRYPGTDIGFSLAGVILCAVAGIAVGFFMPAGLEHAPNIHKGFDLYSAAVPVGFSAFALYCIFFRTLGIAIPEGVGSDLTVQNPVATNLFCIVFFGLCVILALAIGCKPGDYIKMLMDPDHVNGISAKYGNAVMLMNVGIFGLFILAYYNLIGAQFNAVIFGVMFCMLCTCNSGSTPKNVWPIMLGYVVASFVFGKISAMIGGSFDCAVNAQAIAIGLCFANGLSPICSKYGWFWGFIAAIMHYCLVTTVPNLYGGMCLYNGGLTAALTCLLMVPQLERFCKTKAERRAAKSAE